MARSKSLPTIWEVPDDLWERVEWLLHEYDPPKTTITSRVAKLSTGTATKTTSAESAKRNSIRRARRNIRRDDTWSKELWPGYPNAVACWRATRGRAKTTWHS